LSIHELKIAWIIHKIVANHMYLSENSKESRMKKKPGYPGFPNRMMKKANLTTEGHGISRENMEKMENSVRIRMRP
jgi:hypothetical protein